LKIIIKAAAAALALLVSSVASLQAAELVMIDLRSCNYCAKFRREVVPTYNATSAGEVAPLRYVSPLRRWPADLAGIRPAPYTPVFILVEEGREIGRFAGYASAEDFWAKLNPLIAQL
jgi:thioredoxin-related protein